MGENIVCLWLIRARWKISRAMVILLNSPPEYAGYHDMICVPSHHALHHTGCVLHRVKSPISMRDSVELIKGIERLNTYDVFQRDSGR